ncbi:MAG: DNA methyltransferase [Planctomycetota bacterium]
MKIELRKVSDIKPYDKNPRDNDGAVEAVARSIREYGFRQPIVVDPEGVIIVGHTRWKAAQKLGLAEVPVHVATDLAPTQIKAYRIADNKVAELASWDMELLPIELSELRGMDIDLERLGFSSEELEKMLGATGTTGLTDPDAVPEPPDEAVTKPGDLWVLGNHRLLCGDSAKPEDVDRLLGGTKIQLVNTDPPYNVNVASRTNNAIAVAAANGEYLGHQGMDAAIRKAGPHATTMKLRPKDRPLINDFVSDEEFARLLRAWFGNIKRVLEPGRSFYIWGGYLNIWNYPKALKDSELYFSQMVVWVKEHPALTRKDFLANHESCFYGWSEGAGHYFNPEIHNATDVWSVKKINPQQMEHLTAKPIELAVRAMTYSSRPGENVLDLFGGSGSTLIAAERTGRYAFLMEIDPLYCDVIVDRFQRFTGTPAVLERTGASPIPMKPREEDMR